MEHAHHYEHSVQSSAMTRRDSILDVQRDAIRVVGISLLRFHCY